MYTRSGLKLRGLSPQWQPGRVRIAGCSHIIQQFEYFEPNINIVRIIIHS